ncbi:hypothetical protein HDU84_005972 [Entophlyctis sp. JEL0112]|nr:hypothetical protein HDU84_005972 [Entophlyctis sp. JEL0112]
MHLIVLIHGLHGYASDLDHIGRRIRASIGGDDATVFAPSCNHDKTEEGVVIQAARVADEVSAKLATMLQSPDVRTFAFVSLVGHSLGGLIARHVAMLLFPDPRVRLKHYVSIATPHLGSAWRSPLPPFVVQRFAGKTGSDLVLLDDDKDPLLLRMAASEQPWMAALAAFESRTMYACVAHDFSVGLETALAWPKNYLAQHPYHASFTTLALGLLASAPILSSIVPTALPQVLEVAHPISLSDLTDLEWIQLDPKGNIRNIIQSLNSLKWTRVAIFPTRPFLGHVDCVVKSESWCGRFGDSVVDHIVALFTQTP